MIRLVAALIGTASPSPTPATAVLIPTTRPRPSASAPPGVSRVERRVGLDHVVDDAHVCARAGGQRAAEGRDDAGRDRAGEAVRVADRDHELADAQSLCVAELGRREIAPVDAQHGEVGEGSEPTTSNSSSRPSTNDARPRPSVRDDDARR